MASTTPGVVVKISAPYVNLLGSLKVTATVTNTGDETLTLLRDPRGILNPFPGKTFTITNSAGASPLFIGAMIKYCPDRAARRGNPSSFILLGPGASIEVVHDLSAAYDFSRSGSGEYYIEPLNVLFYVDADYTAHQFYATVEAPVKLKLSDYSAFSRFYNILKNPLQAAQSILL